MSNNIEQPLSKLWTFFLNRFRVTLLFALLFFVFGLFAYEQMPQENAPDVEIPMVIVSTVWPGATAEDVENLITEKIESEIKNIEGIKEYTSTSSPGISSIVVEFEIGTNMVENTNDVKDAVDDAKPKLPDSILDDPNVEEANISNIPILTLALSGDYSYSQLKNFAESLSDELETIDGVREARLTGVPDEQYHFYIDPIKLQGMNLSLDEVLQKISISHRDLPLGAVSVMGESVDIRVAGEIESAQEFMSLPLVTRGGQIIRLEDVGEIRREFDTLEVEKFITTGKQAERFIAIDVLKAETKTNVPKTVENSLIAIDKFREKGLFPENLEITTIFNSAEDIEKSLGQLLDSGTQTLLVIVIVLLVALGWREAFLAFISVPLTLLISILGLYIMGETFNFLSLFALVLALGLLVDNSIIVTEGISEGIFIKGRKPLDAARDTLRNFRWPIITGTATTMFAFAPMLFMISGISGEYISGIPKTVILVLSSSLFVSLFILPVFGVMFFRMFPPHALRESKWMFFFREKYDTFMTFVLERRLRTYGLLVASFGLMFFSFYLPASGKVSVDIFPAGDENYFTASVEAPSGTDLETMKTFLPALNEVFVPYFAEEDKWLKNIEISVGAKSQYDPNNDGRDGGNGTDENIIGITINLFDKSERNISSRVLAPKVKEDLLSSLPDYLEIKVTELAAGPPGGDQPIQVKIISDDTERVRELSRLVEEGLLKMKYEDSFLKNIQDNLGDPVPQMAWKFDREKLDRYGLTPSQLQQTLRAGVQGVTVLELTENGDEVDVEARFDFEGTRVWKDAESLDIVSQIPIKTPAGNYIKLSDVADFQLIAQQTRFRHLDGKRTVTIGAQIQGDATAAQFSAQLKELVEALPIQAGDEIKIGGDNEESERLVKEMGMAMLLAVFLILVILVLQFDSFLQSGVILMLLPLSIMGVFLGFWISGTPISFPTMIGIVALAGIIVNDSIVLIDKINHNQKRFGDRFRSYIEAGKSRMQPIFLTSVTTIFGMLPLALSDPIWEGLGFAIIYGMTLATFLTVVLVPCLLIMYKDINDGVVWLVRWPFKFFRRNG